MSLLVARNRLSLWGGRAVASLVLALLSGAAYLVGQHISSLAILNDGLAIAASELELGRVWEQKDLPWKLTISNPTSHTIKVTGFDTSCSCVSLAPTAFVLGPGEYQQVDLKLDLRNFVNCPPFDEEKDAVIAFTPSIEGSSISQVGWKLHGKVRKHLLFSPANFKEKPDFVRGEPFAPKVIKVRSQVPLSSLEAKCELLPNLVDSREEKAAYFGRNELPFCPSWPTRPRSTPPWSFLQAQARLCHCRRAKMS